MMKDEANNIIGIVLVIRDISHTKELINNLEEKKEELEKSHQNKETMLAETKKLLIDLQQTYDKLKETQAQLIQSQKMSAVGQLAGGVAHELNNPMGVILGFAQSIVKRAKEEDPLYMPLKSIERESIRCKNLITDLLIFSRVGKAQSEEIDIINTIDETLSLIEAQAKTKKVQIITDHGIDLPRIMAYKNQIQQVIINLCNNALDAMPEGGRLTISTSSNLDNGKYIEVSVSDTGTGISKENLYRIYEPFFTTKEPGKGTGLGLSLCYETIQRHQGSIEVASEVGKGTTFTIKIRDCQQ